MLLLMSNFDFTKTEKNWPKLEQSEMHSSESQIISMNQY